MANETVLMQELRFSISTTDKRTNVEVLTTITLSQASVPLANIVGSETAGQSRRTRWQNKQHALCKKSASYKIPTSVQMSWYEWIGEEQAPAVVIRDMSPEEAFAYLASQHPDKLAELLALRATNGSKSTEEEQQ